MTELQRHQQTSQSTEDSLTDQQLIARFNQYQDQRAFALLVSRHGPMVQRVCRGVLHNEQDAEDAFQAVFIVLHRRSRHVRWQRSLANWLYGVAYRIALKGRAKTQRRRESNLEHADMVAEQTFEASDWTDVGPAVHEEIHRLPKRYRSTLVLCCLEGRSRRQAATELGLSESAVKGRLERGRSMLKTRLTRRHLALPAVLAGATMTGTAVAGQAVEAAISETLIAATTEAAAQFASGSTAGGPLLSGSITLAKGQLGSMLLATKIKYAVVSLSLLATAGAGTVLCISAQTTAQAPPDSQTQRVPASLEEELPQPNTAESSEMWGTLSEADRNAINKRHVRAIVLAVHAYIDANQGFLPPAAVPNPQLPPEKRLSGLVLLLPYLGVRPSYIAEDDPAWNEWHADHQAAQEIYKRIDLTKAWDDPANAQAAKMIVTEFLSPDGAAVRDRQGRAVTHFAFVRGSRGRDNGMFPLNTDIRLAIPDVMDGTINTLAIGQTHADPGPWIAAGPSTARFIDHPSVRQPGAGFGSRHAGAAWFANGDGATYFWDMASSDPQTLHNIAGRADQKPVDRSQLSQFQSSLEWKMAQSEGER